MGGEGGVEQITGCEGIVPALKSSLYFSHMVTWENQLISLSLNFLIYKAGIVIITQKWLVLILKAKDASEYASWTWKY